MVPDIPASLDIKIKRERFLAKEALQDADDVLQVNHTISGWLGGAGVGGGRQKWTRGQSRSRWISLRLSTVHVN